MKSIYEKFKYLTKGKLDLVAHSFHLFFKKFNNFNKYLKILRDLNKFKFKIHGLLFLFLIKKKLILDIFPSFIFGLHKILLT